MFKRQATAALVVLAFTIGCIAAQTPAYAKKGNPQNNYCRLYGCPDRVDPNLWNGGYVRYSGPLLPFFNIPLSTETIDACQQYNPIVGRNGQIIGWRPHQVC